MGRGTRTISNVVKVASLRNVAPVLPRKQLNSLWGIGQNTLDRRDHNFQAECENKIVYDSELMLSEGKHPISKPENLHNAFNGWTDPQIGIKVTVVKNEPTLDFQSVFLEFHTSEGEFVGDAGRQFIFDEQGRPFVRHGTVKLKDEFQGLGFMRRFNDHSLEKYRDLGIHRVELHATSAGKYAWAVWNQNKNHIHFDPRHDIRGCPYPNDLVRSNAAAVLEMTGGNAIELLKTYRDGGKVQVTGLKTLEIPPNTISQELYTKAKKLIPTQQQIQTGVLEGTATVPYQIAALGKEEAWTNNQGQKTWLGKELILNHGRDWNGVLFL